jgi:hypothetical protein
MKTYSETLLEKQVERLKRENAALRELAARRAEVNNLLNLTPAQFCEATDACKEVRDWAITQPTIADVWDNCPRGDWLVWIARRLNAADDRTLRLFAVWCARSTPLGDGRVTGDLLTDPRSRAALEVAERYAHGQATKEELAAAYATYATDATAATATYAAAYAAAAYAAATTAYAAAYAAYAADAAAAAAAAAAYAADAADAAKQAQADQFRLMVANPFPRTEGGEA